MNNKKLLELLKSQLDISQIYIDEPMKNHTYFKIGGNADYMAEPSNIKELQNLVQCLSKENIDFFVLGNGTNLLISDKGIRSVVIKIGTKMENIVIDGTKVTAAAGCSLRKVANKALENKLTGFEFASGIPGAIGGAINMNAGAYGGEMKDIVDSIKCLDKFGNIIMLENKELNFSYRNSKIQTDKLIVLEATFRLKEGNTLDIKSKMEELDQKRIQKQPINMPSAGSTFKRPEGDYASRLIESGGLKGLQFRGAQVSDKHCGFVINKDNAKCNEIIQLIEVVQKTVRDLTGHKLETEVKVIGEK